MEPASTSATGGHHRSGCSTRLFLAGLLRRKQDKYAQRLSETRYQNSRPRGDLGHLLVKRRRLRRCFVRSLELELHIHLRRQVPEVVQGHLAIRASKYVLNLDPFPIPIVGLQPRGISQVSQDDIPRPSLAALKAICCGKFRGTASEIGTLRTSGASSATRTPIPLGTHLFACSSAA